MENDLPEGWEHVARQHDTERRMFWLKWTVIFPCMLVLVIALFLLFTHKSHAAGIKDRSFLFCSMIYDMPRNCDSVQKFHKKFGRASEWLARRCGASEADIEEARQCLQRAEH